MNPASNTQTASPYPSGTGVAHTSGNGIVPTSANMQQVTTRPAPSAAPKAIFQAEPDGEKIIKIDEKIDAIYTVVGEGDVFSGNLSGSRGVRVTGTVKGNVEAKNGSVIVDAGGSIDGNVVASGRIICFGTIGQADDKKQGDATIACPGIIVTAGEGRIFGTVYYGKLLTAGESDMSFIDGATRPYSKFVASKTPLGQF